MASWKKVLVSGSAAELSSLTLTIVSLTFNPTLYDGVFV